MSESHLKQNLQKTRESASSLALFVTLGLTVIKFIVAFFSNSASLLSEAIHSLLDLVSSLLTFYTVRAAFKPADDDHPYGHGKFETLSSFIEGLLLVLAAVFIFKEAYEQIQSPVSIEHTEIAMVVIAISVFVNFWIYRHNLKAAKQTQSIAIEVNAFHFLADAMTSVMVLVGLILVKVTGQVWIDAAVAFVLGIYVLNISIPLIRKAIDGLTDRQIPDEELTQIAKILDFYKTKSFEAHDLKTRKSGPFRLIDFHLISCAKKTVRESHQVCDEIEAKILALYPESTVHIHVEPCDQHDQQTPMRCELTKGEMCEYRSNCRL